MHLGQKDLVDCAGWKILNGVIESVSDCELVVDVSEKQILMETGEIYIRRPHSSRVVTFTIEPKATPGWAKPPKAVSTSGCRRRSSIG
jgi:hypothetical protein